MLSYPMIKKVVKLVKALNGNLKKEQIAAGFSWGVLLALIPAGNVFWVALFACSFFFKHHHWTKILIMSLFKLFMGLLNPLVDMVGWEVLHIETLQPLYTMLYNMPFVPFTRFNNTLVAGGLVSGLILWLPVFFLMMLFIPFYRNTLISKIRGSKVYKAIIKFPLYPILEKLFKAAGSGK